MAIESVGRVINDGSQIQQQSIDTEDFLKLFLAQLNHQDPLEPVDNREFLAQLAQFSSLQVANSTSENTSNLVDVLSVSQSVALIGKEVQVNSSQIAGGSAIGEVIAIELQGGNSLLGVKLASDRVIRVSPSAVSTVRNL